MSRFDADLRAALEVILEEALPAPEDDDALLFYRQRLAARNLGLVPIADPAGFAWAGHWLARVRAGDGEHAVVMYGSPSGPVHDPAGAFARGTIEEGWLVAPLDLRLSIDDPYGAPSSAGTVEAILVAPAAEEPLRRVDSAEAVAGRGLAGDRYHDGRGTFSNPYAVGHDLTLVEAEVLEELGFTPEHARRNVVTRGIDLNALVGRRFRVGDVDCVGRRLCEPCAPLERLAPGTRRPLVHRGGLRADLLGNGTIRVGDAVCA